MRRILVFLIVAAAVGITLIRESASERASVAPAPTSVAPAPTSIAPTPASSPQRSSTSATRGFRDHAHLAEHFAKHGREFAGLNEAQYLAMAQNLRDRPAGGDVLEVIRAADGVVSRFDKSTGAFLAFDRDGTIRTFFKPNDGEKYFRRQANRAPAQ